LTGRDIGGIVSFVVSNGSTQLDGSHVLDARTPADQLPADPRVLRQMVLALLANVDSLQQELLWYKRHLFGRRSEKLDPDQQMLFDLLEQKIPPPTAASQPVAPQPAAKPSARNGRVPLPRHLPRERIEYHPPQEALTCPVCGQAK